MRTSDDMICPICQEILNTEDTIKLRCKHVIHAKCAIQIVSVRKGFNIQCYCRAEISDDIKKAILGLVTEFKIERVLKNNLCEMSFVYKKKKYVVETSHEKLDIKLLWNKFLGDCCPLCGNNLEFNYDIEIKEPIYLQKFVHSKCSTCKKIFFKNGYNTVNSEYLEYKSNGHSE